MPITKIVAPADALYVSEFMIDFPNGILQKRECGVGNTHLAITNHENYIITVPTVELIENKCFQHANLVGVYGNLHFNEFKGLLDKSPNPKKIMVTYNSLPKLVNWLSTICNPYEDYKLMIDEYHTVLQDYSFKLETIDHLLECALKFNHKTFVSATPIQPKYVPKELKDLDNYEIEWSNTIKIKPIRHKTSKPFQAAVNIIKGYKATNNKLPIKVGNKTLVSEEALFFVNSVKFIRDIIDNAELLPNEVKIICADTPLNRQVLDEYPISKVSDPNRPFTFITSKSFLGSDFYSESAVTYVVSNVTKKNTLYSISSDVFQIAGRIRTKTNPFRNYIYHIYNTAASDLTREEFDKIVEKKKDYTLTQISGYNKLSEHEREAFKKRMSLDLEDDYLTYNEKTNQLEYNELKELNEDFKFNIVYETYTNGLSIRDAYMKAGFDVSNSQLYSNESEAFIAKATSMDFKSILKEYCNIIDCRIQATCTDNEERMHQLLKLEPTIFNIVAKIGTSKCRTLGYTKKAINQYLYDSSTEVNDVIRIKITEKFKKGKIYSSKEVKEYIQDVYNNLKLKKKAKATDISEYISVNKSRKIIDGKKVEIFIVD